MASSSSSYQGDRISSLCEILHFWVCLAAAKSIPGVSAEGAGEVLTLARCAMQETAAAVLPFRDESGVKAYLLDGAQRQKALAEQAALPSTAKGVLGALALLRERCFLCLHYRLGPEMQLTPCTAADTWALNACACSSLNTDTGAGACSEVRCPTCSLSLL